MPQRLSRQCHETGTLIACGPGVERVAEEFAHFFPNARYAIASSDTMHGPGRKPRPHARHGQARDRCADRHPDRRQGPSLSATDIGGRGRCRSGRQRRRFARARAHLPIAASGFGPRRPRRKTGTGAAADPQSRRCGDAGAGAGRPRWLLRTGTRISRSRRRAAIRPPGRADDLRL